MRKKLPIGIQSFESLRDDGYAYVDKTAYIYRLAHEGKPLFSEQAPAIREEPSSVRHVGLPFLQRAEMLVSEVP